MMNKRLSLVTIISLAIYRNVAMKDKKSKALQSIPWEGTLFNMGVMVRDRVYVGHVVREADDVVVVFADEGGERWDIPKKYIKVVGKNVFCDMDLKDLSLYEVSKDSPLPLSIRTDPLHAAR